MAFCIAGEDIETAAISTFPEREPSDPWTSESLIELTKFAWDDPYLRHGAVLVSAGQPAVDLVSQRTRLVALAVAPLLEPSSPTGLSGLLCVADFDDTSFGHAKTERLSNLAVRMAAYLRARDIVESSLRETEGALHYSDLGSIDEVMLAANVERAMAETFVLPGSPETVGSPEGPDAVGADGEGDDEGSVDRDEMEAAPAEIVGSPVYGPSPTALEPGDESYLLAEREDADRPVYGQQSNGDKWLDAATSHDALTGLPRLASVLGRLGLALGQRGQTRSSVALALLEIVPADPAAAPAFDAMVLVAQRIRTRIRTSDTIGRVAPSVLAVVVEMPPDAPPAFMIGGRLVEAAKDVLLWCADEFRLRASVVSADDLVSPGAEELFRVAVEQLGPPA